MNWSGKEAAQLNKLDDYLRELGLSDSRNYCPDSGFTIAAVRGLKYAEVWGMHIKNQWYDIRLEDNSLFYFFKDKADVSFSFLGCPYNCEPYSKYKLKPEFAGFDDSFLQELYENELTSSEIKENPNYFRYDYETNSYRSGEHPVAHMHCGLMDNTRIGLMKELDYMGFAAFVLRQVYVQHWDIVLSNEAKYHELYNFKSTLKDISSQYYQQKDKFQDLFMI